MVHFTYTPPLFLYPLPIAFWAKMWYNIICNKIYKLTTLYVSTRVRSIIKSDNIVPLYQRKGESYEHKIQHSRLLPNFCWRGNGQGQHLYREPKSYHNWLCKAKIPRQHAWILRRSWPFGIYFWTAWGLSETAKENAANGIWYPYRQRLLKIFTPQQQRSCRTWRSPWCRYEDHLNRWQHWLSYLWRLDSYPI